MLPTFWAEWVAPWAPQFHIVQALPNIIFADADAFSTRALTMPIWALVGLVSLGPALIVPRKTAGKRK